MCWKSLPCDRRAERFGGRLFDVSNSQLESIPIASEIPATAPVQHRLVLGNEHPLLAAAAVCRGRPAVGRCPHLDPTPPQNHRPLSRLRLRPPRHARPLPGVRRYSVKWHNALTGRSGGNATQGLPPPHPRGWIAFGHRHGQLRDREPSISRRCATVDAGGPACAKSRGAGRSPAMHLILTGKLREESLSPDVSIARIPGRSC